MKPRGDFIALFRKRLGRAPEEGVSLKTLSSFRIGGTADLFFEARTEDELKTAAELAFDESCPYYIVGGGTNILFDDAGYAGLLIRNKAEGLSFSEKERSAGASAGTPLSSLVQAAVEKGFTGLEFLAGIPGTVGGAVFGNAGAFGRAVGDVVREVLIWAPETGAETAGPESMGFDYRRSRLQLGQGIVLRTLFEVKPGDRETSLAAVRDILEKRKTKHPPRGTACAGSYFKNPCNADGTRTAAGLLLEQSGARGLRIGDAAVYEGHCNFIVNLGSARSEDVLRLARELKDRVFEAFGIRLEEEVVHLPATASMI